MKKFINTTLAILTGMALVLGFQYIPIQEILPAKAQTVRMISGPSISQDPFSSTYLTPTSSTLEPDLPTYALPRINMFYFPDNYAAYAPLQLDINADGLLDFVYSKISTYTTNDYVDQYVILNTGNGFNLAYVCKATGTSSGGVWSYTYKGDCANQ